MPLYEYKCECGKNFDAIQGINEDKLTLCQNMCKEPKKVERLISKSTFIINGAGSMPDRKLYKELDIDK
jgi:putative FmdB family regulatory protein